jgi:ribosomal protein L7/L12
MRIRVWNAFASNNSGSYVIVGSFPSVELASEVAGELLAVVTAQSAWLDARDRVPVAERTDELAPLTVYAAGHGVTYDTLAYHDDWPEHSGAAHPAVWAIGHQVFVYSDYTVTMPRAIGHVMYARGGRVETELNHAHHPIVAVFEIYWPWQSRSEIDVPARVQELVDLLNAETGALTTLRVNHIAPAWRGVVPDKPAGFGDGDLVIGAVFDDLAAGFAAVAAACASVGAMPRIRISEAHAGGDPLAYLRPNIPPTKHALVDVVLDELGLAPTNVVKLVAAARGIGYQDAHVLVQKLPAVILEGTSLAKASELADKLRVGNAVVTLRGAALLPG